MTARLSVVAEMNALLRDMPGYGAAPATRAAWFRRKAGVLRRIAAEHDIPAEAREATELARLADAQADQIGGTEEACRSGKDDQC